VPAGHAPFAILNRSGNQAVRLLLRSPLHGAASGRLALITVTGRRTGRRHTFPVGYTRAGDEVTIPVLWPQRKLWWRNLRGGAPVRLRLRGRECGGQAEAHEAAGGDVHVTVRLDPVA
jgi:hypothetical protein